MKVFTTGQVAKICKVAPRTVSKWFDSGRLKGYRIPGSQDRRIPREYLIKFLKEHGMPLGDLEDEAMAKVLIVAQDQVLIENLKRELPVERSFRIACREWLRSRHSGRKLPPRLYHCRFLDRPGRSAADLPESAPQRRVRRDDPDRPAAGRRQLDRTSIARHQRDVQEAVRRPAAGRAPANADRRPERAGLTLLPIKLPLRAPAEGRSGEVGRGAIA